MGTLLVAAACLGPPAAAGTRLRVDEALRLAFGDCTVERRALFLTDAQMKRVEEAAGSAWERPLVHTYEADCDGVIAGTAYIDRHLVRTLPETILVVVEPDGEVGRVEVLAFDEPPDYLPREGWYRQFDGRGLDEELRLDLGIPRVTGATLTSRATTAAVRRILALHAVLQQEAAP